MATIVTRSGKGSPLTNNEVDANFNNLNSDKIETNAEVRAAVEAATDSNVFTDADHTKLNSVEASADVTDTANVVAALTAGSNITIGNDGTIAGSAPFTLPTAAANTLGGVKIGSGLSIDGSGVVSASGATNLASTTASTNIVITSSTGNNATIAAATTSAAGVMIATDKSKLDGIETSANVTDTANVVAALTAGTNVAIAADGTISATDTNTVYSVGDNGLTQRNFTNTFKSKLEAIEDSATADQTPAQLLTAIKTVDGTGTGLDADLLDGVELSGIVQRTFLNESRNLEIKSNATGSVGIKMLASDSSFRFQLYGSGGTDYGFLATGWGAWDLKKTVSGNLYMNDDTTYYLKTNGTSYLNTLSVLNDLNVGSNSGNGRLILNKADNNVSDHLQFYVGGTRMGEIGAHDTTWLRINQSTAKNIYTPRYIRADEGFYVDGTAKGINGSGNFFGGTIAGASDVSAAAGNSTIVQRNSSGYVFANYFNTTPNTVTSGVTQVCVETANDGYIRHGTGAAIRSFIGFGTASQYLRSDADDSFSGGLVSTARDEGIFGTYSSYYTDHIWSMGIAYKNHSSGSNFGNLYGLAYKHTNNGTGGTMGGGHQMVWCINGTPKCSLGDSIWAAGNITAYSDIRVKEDLEKIPNALDKVCQINGYTYHRTDTPIPATPEERIDTFDHNPSRRHVGLIAQELLTVLPEAVTGGPCNREGSEDDHFSVAYGNVVALLVEAIKELKAEVEELKK